MNDAYDFYLIVHDVEYGGIQPLQTTVVNKKFERASDAERMLDLVKFHTPEAYIVGYSVVS